MVSGCENRDLGIVVDAIGVLVLERHMKMVAVHFEADTVALGCESLLL